jgi:hypothetical protein
LSHSFLQIVEYEPSKKSGVARDSASIAMVRRSSQKVAVYDLAVSFSLLGTFLPAQDLTAIVSPPVSPYVGLIT